MQNLISMCWSCSWNIWADVAPTDLCNLEVKMHAGKSYPLKLVLNIVKGSILPQTMFP